MARKQQENPSLDMTPMIDVVFELIIFFVVTLTEAQKRDETIELEDGQAGEVLTAENMPPSHMLIDIASCDKRGNYLPNGRISISDVEVTPAEIGRRVKQRMDKWGEFPVLIRADFNCRHKAVADVMNACTANGIWKISFVAIDEDKTYNAGKPQQADQQIERKLAKLKEGKPQKDGPRARLLKNFPKQKPGGTN